MEKKKQAKKKCATCSQNEVKVNILKFNYANQNETLSELAMCNNATCDHIDSF